MLFSQLGQNLQVVLLDRLKILELVCAELQMEKVPADDLSSETPCVCQQHPRLR